MGAIKKKKESKQLVKSSQAWVQQLMLCEKKSCVFSKSIIKTF